MVQLEQPLPVTAWLQLSLLGQSPLACPGPLAGKQPGGDMRPNMRRKTGRCEQKVAGDILHFMFCQKLRATRYKKHLSIPHYLWNIYPRKQPGQACVGLGEEALTISPASDWVLSRNISLWLAADVSTSDLGY